MTTEKLQMGPIGRFTPASVADFVERARNVSRFLGMGRRQAEERLAKLYGYATAHDIRIAINKAIAAGEEPGPYNSECSNYIFNKPQRLPSLASVDRGNACLDMAREVNCEPRTPGIYGGGMSSRSRAFREIGLFDEMGLHRKKMRENTIAQDAIDIMEGREPASQDATIYPAQDYTTLKMDDLGECQLVFTTLGEGLAEAISHAMHPDTTAAYDDRDAKLAILQRLHPQNPYIHAARCVNDCYAIAEELIDPAQAIKKAIAHYDDATKLFDQLYADMPEEVKHANTCCRSYMTPFEMDSSGMRIMCEHLLDAVRRDKVVGRTRELTRRLAFFRVGPDGRDLRAA